MTAHEPGLVDDGDVYQQMTDLLFGSWVSQVVRAVADPSQAERLAGGGPTAEELVEWLLKDASRSLRPLVMAIPKHAHWRPRDESTSAVRRRHRQTNATLGADFFTYLEHHPENADAQSVIDAVAGHEGGQGPQQKSRRLEQTRQPARADQQTNPNGLADKIIEATVPHAGSGVTDNETNTSLTQENEETHDRPHKSRW
jgi:hypothetical protein